MRVISQKGIEPMVDLPYEQTMLVVRENFIFATIFGKADMLIAKYFTPEKAEKAMEELHKAYMGIFVAKEIECSPDFEEALKKTLAQGFGIITVEKDCESTSFEPANIVFRFPEDSEV